MTYTWLTGGGTTTVPTSLTATSVNFSIPANATVKRFQVRRWLIQGSGAGASNSSMTPMGISMVWQFTTGFYANRTIHTQIVACPWVVTAFFATAVDLYNSWYNGGTETFGYSRPCDFGGAGKPASNLQFQWFPFFPGGAGNWTASLNYNVAVLYKT